MKKASIQEIIQFKEYTFNKITLVSVTKTYDITILKVIEND